MSSDSITVLRPVVTAATLTPNPVAFNGVVRLSVTVVDQAVVLEPTYFYAGEVFCGEV